MKGTFDHLPLRARRTSGPRGSSASLLLCDERGGEHLGVPVLGIDLGRDPELRPAQWGQQRCAGGRRAFKKHERSPSSWYRKASSAEKSECVRFTLFRINDSIEGRSSSDIARREPHKVVVVVGRVLSGRPHESPSIRT